MSDIEHAGHDHQPRPEVLVDRCRPEPARHDEISVVGTPQDLQQFFNVFLPQEGQGFLAQVGLEGFHPVQDRVQQGEWQVWSWSSQQGWHTVNLNQGQVIATYDAGIPGPAGHGPLTVRRYKYILAAQHDYTIDPDQQPHQVAHRLNDQLSRAGIHERLKLDLLSFCGDRHGDHPAGDDASKHWTHGGDLHFSGHEGGHISPVDADAWSAVDATGNADGGRNAYETQPAWARMGFPPPSPNNGGAGVTIVILDSSPSDPRALEAGIVDYWLDLSETKRDPVREHVHDEGHPHDHAHGCSPLREEHPPMPPHPLRRLNADDLAPFHGPIIAALCRKIAPKSKIFLIRVLDDNGNCYSSTLTSAMRFVMALRDIGDERVAGRHIVFNMSLGIRRSGPEDVDDCCLLFTTDYVCSSATLPGGEQVEGALVVAAAGNASSALKHRNAEEPAAYGQYGDTPATLTRLLAVGATSFQNPWIFLLKPNGEVKQLRQGQEIDRMNQPLDVIRNQDPGLPKGVYAFFSNEAFLGAYGQDMVLKTCNSGAAPYGFDRVPPFIVWSGSSFATPLVAATAALLLAEGEELDEVKQRLWRTATEPDAWNGIRELNIAAATQACKEGAALFNHPVLP